MHVVLTVEPHVVQLHPSGHLAPPGLSDADDVADLEGPPHVATATGNN